MKDDVITIRATKELREALEAYAKREDLSLSQVGRRALKEFLEKAAK